MAAAGLVGCKQKQREFPEPETESPEGVPYRSDCAALSGLPAPELEDAAYVADFVQVWQTVLDKHYDPTLGCLDWAVVGERYGKRVVEAGDDIATSAEAHAYIAEAVNAAHPGNGRWVEFPSTFHGFNLLESQEQALSDPWSGPLNDQVLTETVDWMRGVIEAG